MKIKTIALATCLVMLFCLAALAVTACDFSDLRQYYSTETFTKFDGEIERNVTIRVLENDTAISVGYFDELLDAFNEAYAEYGITAVDANMDSYTDLALDGPFGYGPDVLYQANDVLMEFAADKHVLPLPVEEMECYQYIPEAAWDAYEANIEGGTYTCGVPVNIQAPMLYYRKDLLPADWETTYDDNANGVPDMVESWNALYRYSQKIRSETPDKYGYMKSLSDSYFALGYLFSYGGYVFGDNNTNARDIGIAAGQAEIGARIIQQLASVMNMETVDDSITLNSYSRLGDGTYFATMTTPDVYTMFIREMEADYTRRGYSASEAAAMAEENLVMTDVPTLPVNGDLEDDDAEQMGMTVMGGVNGYAISSYTKAPKACLAFVEFATSYEMVMLRNEYLGIAPARSDVAAELGGLSERLFEKLDAGEIVVMPSISAVGQLWDPLATMFGDIAEDAFRDEPKYPTLEALKRELQDTADGIYSAIFTLQ